MAVKKIRFQVERAGRAMDVIAQGLASALAQGALGREGPRELSNGDVRRMIVAGAVLVDRRKTRPGDRVRSGAVVEVFVDTAKLKGSQHLTQERAEQRWEVTPADIVYQDEDLIAINKPYGMPTQPTLDRARDNLYEAVLRYEERRVACGEGTAAYIGLHHRLDRDTSGVVLFTRRKEANVGVARLFKDHLIAKSYRAIVSRERDAKNWGLSKWTTKNFLGRVQGGVRQGKAARFGSVRSGGDPAVTEFEVVSINGEFAEIIAKPKTGRTHQIRVHLSEDGLPILGDGFYGGRVNVGGTVVGRMLLHAYQLEFEHPTIPGQIVEIGAPEPEDYRGWVEKLGLQAG